MWVQFFFVDFEVNYTSQVILAGVKQEKQIEGENC